MNRAIRAVSIERGFDPREFGLVAFGGGGGLHACALAADLDMPVVIVPRFAEGLSALGMLLADCVRDYSAGVLGEGARGLERQFAVLDRLARRESAAQRTLTRTADLRYQGQSYEINVPWSSRAASEEAFHREHERQYGYATPERKVEVVTIRVRSLVPAVKLSFPPVERRKRTGPSERRVCVGGRWRPIPVLRREEVPGSGAGMRGPLLVTDYGATTLVEAGWRAKVDKAGNLVLTAEGS
jgi:N-methylhydantoinase A